MKRSVKTKAYMGRRHETQPVVIFSVLMVEYVSLKLQSSVISLVLSMRPCIISTRIGVSKPEILSFGKAQKVITPNSHYISIVNLNLKSIKNILHNLISELLKNEVIKSMSLDFSTTT
jgi:hypothetical protein